MTTLSIGGVPLNRIGLGTNRITATDVSRDLLSYAVSRGVNVIDTAHVYTGGVSEQVIGETLSPFPKSLIVASKTGMSRAGVDGTPATLRRELEQCLTSLKTDQISLYQLHRVDPQVPIQDSVRALKSFQDEGKIAHIGLSEVTVSQIKQARAVATITSVQNHYNVFERRHDPVVDYCQAEGIIFFPFFPLGGSNGPGADDQLTALAAKYHATPRQLALAWLLKRAAVMVPIPGTLSRSHLDENLSAADIVLDQADYDIIANFA